MPLGLGFLADDGSVPYIGGYRGRVIRSSVQRPQEV